MASDLFASNDNVDPSDFWSGLDLWKLPKTARIASDMGIKFFFTGEECRHGHVAPKYTAGGRCVACARIHSAVSQGNEYKGNFKAARANMQRAIAAVSMKRTYEPTRPCKHGHMLRYVGSNNCVECNDIARAKRREKAKEARLLKLYGIDFKRREEMASTQDYRCAICLADFTDNRTMHVDHCHSTGAVRGLLCSNCNQAIGLLQDNPEIIRSAADYVEFHKKRAA